MSKAVKLWLIAAGSLILLGLITFVSAMAANHWDFTTLSSIEYITSQHEVSADFTDIEIDTNTADIHFLHSEDGKCKVVCYEESNVRHNVSIEDGKLKLHAVNEKKWYEYIMNFDSAKITIYLPKTEYGALVINGNTCDVNIGKAFTFSNMDVSVDTGDVSSSATVTGMIKIKTTTGDIQLHGINANEISLEVSTGDIRLTGVNCQRLTSSGDTGDMDLRNVIASDKLSIVRNTGDVAFNKCDAGEIYIKTNTGDVEGSLLSEKIFTVKSNTGDENVPQTFSGGKCEITSNTGDINIYIAE